MVFEQPTPELLNPDYALGIKELVNLLTNPSDCAEKITSFYFFMYA